MKNIQKKHLNRAAVGAFAATLVAGGVSIATAPTASAYGLYHGAIAVSPSTGATGRSWDYDTQSQANNEALGQCGYNDCEVLAQFTNGCGAVADSGDYYGGGAAEDLYSAESQAYGSAGGGYILVWQCTSGHQ